MFEVKLRIISKFVAGVLLRIESFLFPVFDDAEEEIWKVEPEFERGQDEVILIIELGEHVQHEGIWEVERKRQVGAQPGQD